MDTPTFPTTSGSLALPGPAGALEVAVDHPDDDVAALPLVAIICHPLTTEGGTMHNKVVTMTARALRELGATTVRFNFRGAGDSEGEFDEGDGEVDDLLAVAAWVRAQCPGRRLWLAGFSFGAYVSLVGASEIEPGMLISIAPPAGRWDFDSIQLPTCPWIVIQGEEDEIVNPQAVYDWLDEIDVAAELVRIPDSGHFFHRKLMDLRGAVKNGVRQHLPAADA